MKVRLSKSYSRLSFRDPKSNITTENWTKLLDKNCILKYECIESFASIVSKNLSNIKCVVQVYSKNFSSFFWAGNMIFPIPHFYFTIKNIVESILVFKKNPKVFRQKKPYGRSVQKEIKFNWIHLSFCSTLERLRIKVFLRYFYEFIQIVFHEFLTNSNDHIFLRIWCNLTTDLPCGAP